MKCPTHRRHEVLGTCAACESFVCSQDALAVGETLYCRSCAPSAKEAFARKKRPGPRADRRDAGFGGRRRFRSFEAARRFVQKLGLKNTDEWRAYARSGRLPEDIPRSPERYSEWVNMGDWLGTGNVNNRFKYKYILPFAEARRWAQTRGLSSRKEYYRRARAGELPKELPLCPERSYAEDWEGWGDFLGTGWVRPQDRKFRPFAKARAYARSLGIETYEGWQRHARGSGRKGAKLPLDIPGAPWGVYKDEWRGMNDWLGVGRMSGKERRRHGLRSFEKARAFARSLGFEREEDWRQFVRGERPEKGELPDDILPNPRVYPEFVSIRDWLGVSTLSTLEKHARRWPFAKARAFARKLGLRNKTEWMDYVSGAVSGKPPLPDGVPRQPWQQYRGEYRGIEDWLGASFTLKRAGFWSFEKARAWARASGIATYDEWIEAARGRIKVRRGRQRASALPPEVPAAPWAVYPDAWRGIGDWLGTGNISNVEKHRRRVAAEKARRGR